MPAEASATSTVICADSGPKVAVITVVPMPRGISMPAAFCASGQASVSVSSKFITSTTVSSAEVKVTRLLKSENEPSVNIASAAMFAQKQS